MSNETTQLFDLKAVKDKGLEAAVLAGGCFWCIEAVFEQVPGVVDAISGYTGGTLAHPDYESVCTGRTGHAEAVLLVYDPLVIPYGKILDLFWRAHDPTSLNRQGADRGTQYRSAVYWTSQEQKQALDASMKGVSGIFDVPLVTEVKPLGDFWVAEEYHQDYYRRNPGQGYCAAVIRPKLQKLKKDIGGITL